MSSKTIAIALITLVNMGVFAIPATSQASWSDVFGNFGIGGYTNKTQEYQGGPEYYDYNSTNSYDDGDIEISKEVKEIGEDDSYHDKIEVRSGALVEVWIEIKNTDDKATTVLVRDEIGSNTVYVQNSLRVNGQTSQPGLTSGGLRINIPAKGKAVITYRMNVCGNSGYPMRAYATAPGVGAATDAIIIYTKSFNAGYYDDSYSCYSQFQSGITNYNGTAVYSANNPFAGWYGVNNLSSTEANNPFAGWYGVNNANATVPATTTAAATTNPFGDWYGVQNDPTSNPFGTWTGVSNSQSVNNPFGDWYGVNSTGSTNPFGDWNGVNSNLYDARGYSTGNTVTYNSTNTSYRPSGYQNATYAAAPQTYRVAPNTGVEKSAPLVFAGILTAGFVIFRKRKLIFN